MIELTPPTALSNGKGAAIDDYNIYGIIFTCRIDIDIDFNARPKDADPTAVIDRLERIEKETFERFKAGNSGSLPIEGASSSLPKIPSFTSYATIMSDFDIWKGQDFPPIHDTLSDVDELFNDDDINRIEYRRQLPEVTDPNQE